MTNLRRAVIVTTVLTSLSVLFFAIVVGQGLGGVGKRERHEGLTKLAAQLAMREAPTSPDELERLESEIRQHLGASVTLRVAREAWTADAPFRLAPGESGPVFSAPFAGSKHVATLAPVPEPDAGGAVLLLAIAGSFFFAWLISRWTLRPVSRRLAALERVGERLAAGDLLARADDPEADAIGRVAHALDRVGGQLRARFETQRELLQAVSHELRTPAARARFRLELLQEAESDSERERHMTGIDHDISALDALVDELLIYVRFDRGQRELQAETLDVAAVLSELAEDARGFRGACSLELRGEPGPKIEADSRHFRRAIENLLLNAFRYAESSVVLSWEPLPSPSGIRIAVEDDGPGIAPEQLDRIFEPFARADVSRGRESGGAGLGLAIVRRIVDGHGGEVRATASPSGGARFVIEWPTVVTDTNRDERKTE